MTDARPFGLFDCYGIELEYMIVDAESLDIRPIADRLLLNERGEIEDELEHGAFAWSNELALHVIELKTNGPSPTLDGLATGFSKEIKAVNALLARHGARLLPTGMHPWFDPEREFQIWPHGRRTIYETFDRIFDCSGHGWANLQSMHVNLPFANDEEFGRLHAAVRALLPILPALGASTPFIEGRHPGTLDTRLDVYRHNAKRVPSVSGRVIPEPIFTRRDYETMLEGIYADLAPEDPAGLLRHEWVNSRGCIARFDRMAIEIRVLDTQECPQADIAIAAAVSRVLRSLCEPDADRQRRLRALETDHLARIFQAAVITGDAAKIDDDGYSAALGLDGSPKSAGEIWRRLLERDVLSDPDLAAHVPVLEVIVEEGPVAKRLLRRLGTNPSRSALHTAYREMADCLSEGTLFRAAP